MDSAAIRVGGLTPMTTIDLPGRLAAVVFCQGCPWRCGYCHNPGLQLPRADTGISWEETLAFLSRRRGLLDGVVFSGGEPTAQPGLATGVAQVRGLGFQVGLHTAGAYPRRLAAVLPHLDWVGLDIKTVTSGYAGLTGGGRQAAYTAWKSLDHLLRSEVDFEVRTTWHPAILSREDLCRLAEGLAGKGVRRYVLQRYTPPPHAPSGPGASVSPMDAELIAALGALFPEFEAR